MRYVIRRITVLTAALLVLALPLLAAEGQIMGPAQQSSKNECLLNNDCGRVQTFQDRIDEIKGEINKGTAVYTNEELGILNKKLKDTISQRGHAYESGVWPNRFGGSVLTEH